MVDNGRNRPLRLPGQCRSRPFPRSAPRWFRATITLEIAPYAPGEAEEKPVVRVVEMTSIITHRAKLLAHSPEPGVRALADKKMPGAIAQAPQQCRRASGAAPFASDG